MQYHWLNKNRSNPVATFHTINSICTTANALRNPIKPRCHTIQDSEIEESALKTQSLIIFFAGWSFDYIPFEFLGSGDFDVLVIYDYNDISSMILDELQTEFARYGNITLITWSMGVYVAEYLKDYLPPQIDKKIAINGTLCPVNNEFGIPQKIFDLTVKFAETGLRQKFYKNIFENTDEFERYSLSPVERSLEDRVSELKNLSEFINCTEYIENKNFYDFAIVSKFDKIIPPKNQHKFWQSIGCDIIELETGHFPFYRFNSWNEIINANKSKNSKETI